MLKALFVIIRYMNCKFTKHQKGLIKNLIDCAKDDSLKFSRWYKVDETIDQMRADFEFLRKLVVKLNLKVDDCDEKMNVIKTMQDVALVWRGIDKEQMDSFLRATKLPMRITKMSIDYDAGRYFFPHKEDNINDVLGTATINALNFEQDLFEYMKGKKNKILTYIEDTCGITKSSQNGVYFDGQFIGGIDEVLS